MSEIIVTPGSPLVVTITPPTVSPVIISAGGPVGPAGADGADGADGATGPTGPQGPAGNDGADGKTYTISCVDGDNSDEEKIRLTDSDGTTDDVVLEAGTGMSIARSGDKITLTNTVTDTNTQLTTEQVQDIVGAMLTGNTETRISVTYDDSDGTIDFVVDDMTATGISNVVEDSTPQLGGALDTNGNAIQFRDTGDTNYVELKPSTLEPASNVTFFLPIADGSNGQVLQTNGSGRLSFVDRATVGKSLTVACSDETSDLTTGTAKATFRMPEAATITGVRASVTTAPVGSALTVDINESGTTILSTKLTIDAGEKTSTTAATAAVISDTSIADDAEMTIDIDAIGSSTAGAGLKVTIYYNPA